MDVRWATSAAMVFAYREAPFHAMTGRAARRMAVLPGRVFSSLWRGFAMMETRALGQIPVSTGSVLEFPERYFAPMTIHAQRTSADLPENVSMLRSPMDCLARGEVPSVASRENAYVFPNAPRDFAGMQTSAVAPAVVWKVRHARVENASRIPVGGSIMTGYIPSRETTGCSPPP